MSVQLQYIQLITDKTNAADLSWRVFAVLISVTRTKNTKFIAVPQILSKSGKPWRNKGSTELYCLFIAADSIVDAISFIRRIVLWSENELSPNPDPAPAGFEFLNPLRSAWI